MAEKTELNTKETSVGSTSEPPTSKVRRKLLKAGMAGPVIMTLASRPALARNFCTISGWGSVTPSGRPEDYSCEGRSPGFWMTYWEGPTAAAWALTGFNPGPTNPIPKNNGNNNGNNNNGNGNTDNWDYSVPTNAALAQAVTAGDCTQTKVNEYKQALMTASTFDQLMGSATTLPDLVDCPITRPTIMQVFHVTDLKQHLPNNAAWHYAASLLNAAAWGEEYGYTLGEMRALIQARDGEGKPLIDDLEGLYDRA